ncbi:hypothetical protein XBP1_750001 [Xenorhabdus bovienii str. puntauvense]|uniref:Uncharacterized protein n=1 Tax=Xenorhabdus bovienii str. puntauvense TaxID=1398201 RepID=A0A077NK72_XENBV|nr:hypothetical protein XBP1_750001 [Xenorhabdus bovienii str. puntauvense]
MEKVMKLLRIVELILRIVEILFNLFS